MQFKGTHHIAISTQNMAAMEKFYTETLGFPVVKRWADVNIVFIDIGSTLLELIGSAAAPAPGVKPGAIDHIALLVDNVDASYQALVAKGVRIQSAPEDFKDVRICFFSDPDGNSIELLAVKA